MGEYGDAVWRACALYFGSSPDAQDAFQDTFVRYSLHEGSFNDEEHRKAWLLRVAVNRCKDLLKASHRTDESLDARPSAAAREACIEENHILSPLRQALDAIWALDDPPRTPVYLSLYEGYSAPQIAEMTGMPVNTVYSHIARGKKLLKEALA